MQKNVSRLDAWIRGGFAIVLLAVAAIFNHRPVISLVAALVALVLMGTALTGNCLLYRVLGVSSRTPNTHGL
jgi:hypothetical protein